MSAARFAGRAALVALALTATAVPASAHLVRTGFGTFYDGVLHLLVTPSDVLVVLGLSLLGGLLGKREARRVVLVLPSAWLVGGLIGVAFPSSDELEAWTALGALLVGLLVAAKARLSLPAFTGLACTIGALHGFVTGSTTTAAGGDLLTLTGAVLATFAFTSLTTAFVVSLRADWTRVAVRAVGSWIAAIGLLMLAWLARAS